MAYCWIMQKTNPYFDEAYLAQQVDVDRKQQYVYGIAALSQAKGFKQTDFDKARL